MHELNKNAARSKPRDEERARRILDLHLLGWSNRKIAKLIGTSVFTVQYYLRRWS
jgi:transposase